MPDHPAQPSQPADRETGHPDLRRTCGLVAILLSPVSPKIPTEIGEYQCSLGTKWVAVIFRRQKILYTAWVQPRPRHARCQAEILRCGKDVPPARTQHTRCLCERRGRIRHVFHDILADHQVEASVRERQPRHILAPHSVRP